MIRLIRIALAAAVFFGWALPGMAQSGKSLPGPEDAAGALLLVYYGPAKPDGTIARARDALERLVSERGGSFVDMSPSPPAPPAAAEPLGQAMEAYHAFEHERALSLLDAALADAERTGAADLSIAQLSDLFIYRGLVLTQLGRSAEAWDAFVRAATLDPTRKLDPVRYAPRVIETFSRALAAVDAAATAELTIAAAPECRATLNGAPVTGGQVVAVPYGKHFFRAECPGAPPSGSLVSAQRPQQTVLLRASVPVPPNDKEIARLARASGHDSAVAVTIRGEEQRQGSEQKAPTLTARRIEARSARTRARVAASLPASTAAGEARRAVLAVLVAAPALSSTEGIRPMKAQPAPWYRRPWVWAICGAAVTAAVLAPLALRSSSDDGFVVSPGGDLPP